MKKQFATLALSSFFGLALLAAPQENSAPTPQNDNAHAAHHQSDPARQLQALTKKLNLTADQQNQILPILKDRDQQLASLRNDTSLSKEDRRSKLRSLREDSQAKIKNVLTDDQKKTYD
jgi:periplasmic protein CpxP/Spy